jgi:nucleoid-associated protein EbfC
MNIGDMMRQVQDMQAKMAQMQEKLGTIEVLGQSGGGRVQATMNGKGEMKKLKLDPKLVDPAEIEVLEDLIVAACNDAKGKMDAEIARETEQMMGGIKLPPGMKLPF